MENSVRNDQSNIRHSRIGHVNVGHNNPSNSEISPVGEEGEVGDVSPNPSRRESMRNTSHYKPPKRPSSPVAEEV